MRSSKVLSHYHRNLPHSLTAFRPTERQIADLAAMRAEADRVNGAYCRAAKAERSLLPVALFASPTWRASSCAADPRVRNFARAFGRSRQIACDTSPPCRRLRTSRRSRRPCGTPARKQSGSRYCRRSPARGTAATGPPLNCPRQAQYGRAVRGPGPGD